MRRNGRTVVVPRFPWELVPVVWLAFGLRAWRLGAQSLWYDEGYSFYLGAHLPLDEALELTVRDIVPPLYYLLLRAWSLLAGTSEYALRFLSVLFGVLAVALVGRIARELVRLSDFGSREPEGRCVSLLSAGLVAIAPVFIWLAQDARMYGPLVTWTLLAAWGLLLVAKPRASRKSRRIGWALFVGAGLAALYTHTVSVFWLLGQLAFGLVVVWQGRQERERVREALAALGLMAAGYLPWLIVALVSFQTNAGYWPGYLPPPYLWRKAWDTFVGGQQLAETETALAAIWFGITALMALVLLLARRRRSAAYLVLYLVIPLLAMGLAFQRTPKLAARYPTAMAPALFLLMAAGGVVAYRASRFTRFAFIIGLLGVVILSFYADAKLYFDPSYGKDDWRAAAEFVRAHREPDEAVLLISGHAYPVFAYYYGWEGWDALPDDVQLDVNHVLNYPTVAPQLNQVLERAKGAWLVQWQDEVVDPTGLVPALLEDVGRELPAPVFPGAEAGDEVGLRHYELDAAPQFSDELPVQHPLEQTVAPGLTTLGYDVPSAPLPADAEVPVRVFWQAEEPLKGAHAASLRITDRLGQEWGRRDALLAGPYFSERWPVGMPIMGQYTVTLPSGAPPGTYQPTLTVYREDEVYETVSLSQVVITRPLATATASALELAPASEPLVSDLSLVGVGFDQTTATPCQNWSLSLAWRVEAQPKQTYGLHLRAGSNEIDTPLAPDYPTTQWKQGDVWRSRHQLPIACRALDGTYPVEAQLTDSSGAPVGDAVKLGELTVVAGRQYDLPEDLTAEVHASLPDVGTLIGYRIDSDRVKPGGNLQVTLYWRATRETDHNYSVFTHVQGDRVWAQHDSWPADGQKPTSTWAEGEVIRDHHVIPIGEEVPPGPYWLVVGMYDAETLRPLVANGSDGQPIEGGRVLLQPIAVYPP
jgi:mannosyltransferase